MANVSVGQEAPDFTLRNEDNQPVKLSELRGKPVVLVFYPLDFSPLCTSEMCAIRDDYSSFQAKGAQVFGISRDSTWTHKAFKEGGGTLVVHSLQPAVKQILTVLKIGRVVPLVADETEARALAIGGSK